MIAINRTATFILCFFAAGAIAGCSQRENYTTFEDCVLAEITANQNEAAVVVTRDACRMKFPNPSPSEKQLIALQDNAQAERYASGDAAAADAAQAAADTAAAAADAAAAAASEGDESQQ